MVAEYFDEYTVGGSGYFYTLEVEVASIAVDCFDGFNARLAFDNVDGHSVEVDGDVVLACIDAPSVSATGVHTTLVAYH